ncbi:PREDICTED: GTP-binding protein REM 1 isoform X2 [Charadrius vociferus]|uniref:GTP-binding protein REM 1 isoform X2 n=1 Tax=Charadrius vociferus TaxID=50402 RepID=UPI0005215565|nr:PREDICTED: GTP-binding protein REM 1 isoform X2 [Charadrius vociferus]
MTLNTQRGSKSPLRRRASTPLPRPGVPGATSQAEPCHPQLGHSTSEPGGRAAAPRGRWSSESSGSSSSWDPLYRVVLLGDPGVGKTSLANLFAGVQERDLLEQHGEAAYERTLSVDGEETTLLVMDTWEPEQRDSRHRSQCLKVGNAYVIVYSVTDRGSFESASELRIQLRRVRQAEDIPIILVGNKTDLVRCREVSVEEGRACAVVFDCKFIETSAALQHNVAELFEGVVRQIRLRRGGKEARMHPNPSQKRKESLTKRARRFLDRLVARNTCKVALKVRSKSCHDLSVL